MKKIRLILFLTFVLSTLTLAKDYYIGEKIALELSGSISEDEIRESLKDYKIIELKKEKKDKLTVIFTTYEVGEKIVIFKNKSLKFNIASTLKDDEKEIYPQLSDEKNRYVEKDYPYSAILSFMIGIIAISISVIMHLIDRSKNPYLLFKKGISKISSENWKELISLELRKYIDRKYKKNFCGGDYEAIHSLDTTDIEFIKSLDYLKFSKSKNEDYTHYKKKAIEIVEKLRKEKITSV
ncbi:MAG: hypothetical protein ACRC0V_11670 [Fusobacteriaceae bacterium]